MAWSKVHERLQAGAAGLLPVGAACKEHGHHLPMHTDLLQAEWFANAIARRADILIWPTLGYGYYPAFLDYPGSCSLSRDTFLSVVVDIISDIARAGASPIFVLNTGISTIATLQEAVTRMQGERAVALINLYEGKHYRRLVAELEEQSCGGHADEFETSIMLAIAPQEVDMKCAVANTEPMQPGPLNRTDPGKPNFSPSGVYGDPVLATADKGRMAVAAILRDIAESMRRAEFEVCAEE
jgi:creatinine amidohydrolase